MNTKIKYLKDYVAAMCEQMNQFNRLNTDLLRKFEGRLVRVRDSLGNSVIGYFKGFGVTIRNEAGHSKLTLYVSVLLLRKDGTPSNRTKVIGGNDLSIRMLAKR